MRAHSKTSEATLDEVTHSKVGKVVLFKICAKMDTWRRICMTFQEVILFEMVADLKISMMDRTVEML